MKFKLVKDVEDGLKDYPSLHLTYKDGKPVVEGTFTARKKNVEVENYDVIIGFPPKYPNVLPWVIETSQKILPRNATRHIFVNDTLCFGNHQDVLRVCRNGITFSWFLDNILNSHFCREYVREITGNYPTGERGHGNEGTWEGYYEIFNTSDKASILEELDLMLSHTLYSKNKQCFCNSGKKYKRCHQIKEQSVFDVGRHNVMKLYRLLKDDCNSAATNTPTTFEI